MVRAPSLSLLSKQMHFIKNSVTEKTEECEQSFTKWFTVVPVWSQCALQYFENLDNAIITVKMSLSC